MIYQGPIVDLKERYRVDEKTAYDGVATVFYDILLHDTSVAIGRIDLRFNIDNDNLYYGHIGYHILIPFRGHSYAYEACKVLFEIAKNEFKMNELIITCSPENKASYRTLIKLGGDLIDEVDVPVNHYLFKNGEVRKCIFHYDL